MRQWKIKEIETIKIHGRYSQKNDQLALFYTGSGIEMDCTGSELWVEVEVRYDMYEPWISILYNGERVSRQMLTEGRYWIPIFRNMNKDTVKNLRLMKDVQAMSGDLRHSLILHQLRSDGDFLPLEAKKIRFEFIGDSITSGEGLIGAKQEEEWVSMWFDSVKNYTYLTAKAYDAEYRVISQSGWGVYCSWDHNTEATLGRNYEKVCGVVSGKYNRELGASDDNDFLSWKPDVIVINLGTNDGGAFTSKGGPSTEDIELFIASAVDLLAKLRNHNPDAYLLWAYGMLGKVMEKAIGQAIEQYQKVTKDQRVGYVDLPDMDADSIGARNHPGTLAHERAAEALTLRIKEILE